MPEARGGAQEGSPPTSRVGCWRAEGVTPQYWTVVGELEGCWKAASVDAARSNKGWWWWWCIGRMVVHRARVSAGSPRPGAGRLAADESCGWLDGRRCPSVLDGRGASWEDAGRPRGWTLYTTLLFMPTMERVCRAVSIADVNDQVASLGASVLLMNRATIHEQKLE